MVDGSADLAQKALDRRVRISIFGGLPKATKGRRTAEGRIFNRRAPLNLGSGVSAGAASGGGVGVPGTQETQSDIDSRRLREDSE